MSQLKVNTIRHTGASSDAVTLASDGTCTAKITNQPPGNRNLIINGSMICAQRGASSTSGGYQTVDRFTNGRGGMDEAITQAQHALTSSDTGPWEKGFRYSYHLTNGNQTSGAGAADYCEIYQYIEDQNISNSGWNYASSSSYLTISFWVKSSVAQKFYGFLYTNQAAAGDCKMYSYAIDNGSGGSLSANTWTKITHTIPGDSSLTFNNDNTNGLAVGIIVFNGVNYTTSGHTLNTWTAWDSADKIPDISNTWWNTDEATFEITGVQLEVGDVATDFEHRSFGDELARCQRYYQKSYDYGTAVGTASISAGAVMTSLTGSGQNYASAGSVKFPVQMRATPTMTVYSTASGTSGQLAADSTDGAGTATGTSETGAMFYRNNSSSGTGENVFLRAQYTAEAEL